MTGCHVPFEEFRRVTPRAELGALARLVATSDCLCNVTAIRRGRKMVIVVVAHLNPNKQTEGRRALVSDSVWSAGRRGLRGRERLGCECREGNMFGDFRREICLVTL